MFAILTVRPRDRKGPELKQPHTCSDAELYESIDRAHAAISALQRGQLRFIREFDKRELWKRDGRRNMGEWLAGRFGISLAEGLRRVKAAHALEELPLISSAVEEGRLSLEKAQLLASFATPTTEEDLLRWARRSTLSAVWKRAARMKRRADDELLDAHQRRYLSIYPDPDELTYVLQGELPAEQGSALTRALDRLAAQIPTLPDEKYDLERKRADALMAMASGRIAADPDADRATVVMHAELGAVQGTDPNAELHDGTVIHPDIARRISCDCRLQVVLHDADGNPVGIGRTARNIPTWLWRALMSRDGGCVFPGCGTRRFVDGHHIVHWEDGGPTDINNLVAACRFHHDLVHKFKWRVELDENQVAVWYRPNGERFDPAPRQTPLDEQLAASVEVETAESGPLLQSLTPALAGFS